jgi:transcriptional regulator MraZ
VFKGHETTRADDKGRLKVPSVFRSPLESKYGRELFVTSITGDYVRLYPMPVWAEIEKKLETMPNGHPSRARFLDRVNYYGQVAEIDAQGRVLIPARLRETAGIAGDIDVLGQVNFLDAWNHDRLASKLQREPFTDDDARALAEYGI